MLLSQHPLAGKLLALTFSLTILTSAVSLSAKGVPISTVTQSPTPTDIKFEVDPAGKPLELTVGSKKKIAASVRDQNDNRVHGLVVTWQVANPGDEKFVLLAERINSTAENSVAVVGLSNQNDPNPPSQVPIIAKCGEVWRVIVVNYSANVVRTNTLSTDPKDFTVTPGGSASFTVSVKDDKGADVDPIKIETELAPEANPFLTVTSSNKTKIVTVTGKYGDSKKPISPIFSLIVRAAGAVNVVAVRYVYDPVKAIWDVIPPKIVGDLYGRTIKNDYYCIEITIQNYSGDDIALASIGFDLGDPLNLRPNSSYSTAHGSLERRKLTYPRTLILAGISATGSLMTGFNPFFHNVVHAKNFSQGIDIISNPLAKGFALAVPDSYPDELARFERDILRDEKLITNGSVFKSKIFIAKRDVFPTSADGDKNNINDIRDALGQLVISGYRFKRGEVVTLTNSLATPAPTPSVP